MITKEAEQRLKILKFWREYGLKATTDAYGAKKSTLYLWDKKYRDSGYRLISLNPLSQKRKNNNQRGIHPLLLKEIKRLRLEEYNGLGKLDTNVLKFRWKS
ncbi:MAG: hypothetical protein WC178_00870 [Candidatus Paceibacterota bacterium]